MAWLPGLPALPCLRSKALPSRARPRRRALRRGTPSGSCAFSRIGREYASPFYHKRASGLPELYPGPKGPVAAPAQHANRAESRPCAILTPTQPSVLGFTRTGGTSPLRQFRCRATARQLSTYFASLPRRKYPFSQPLRRILDEVLRTEDVSSPVHKMTPMAIER